MLTATSALSSLRPAPARLFCKPFSSLSSTQHRRATAPRRRTAFLAKLGGGGESEGEVEGEKDKAKKGFISAEEEPDEYFKSKKEEQGGLAPLKDPIAIVGILGILLPFVILGIAIATGVVDPSPKLPSARP